MSRAEIAARVRSGEWTRDGSGVLRATDHPVTPRSRIRAAMFSLGEGRRWSGARPPRWHDDQQHTAEIEGSVPTGRRTGPQCPSARGVAPGERVVVDGVAVTKKPATVLAAVATLGLLLGARS